MQAARKPNFVLDDHSSRRSIAAPLKQPTRGFRPLASLRKPALHGPERDGPSRARRIHGCDGTPCLFGLAPCGVYHAVGVTPNAVGSYPTFSPLPPFARRRFVFCCTGRPDALKHPSRTLSGTLPCGVRTFLPLRTGLRQPEAAIIRPPALGTSVSARRSSGAERDAAGVPPLPVWAKILIRHDLGLDRDCKILKAKHLSAKY